MGSHQVSCRVIPRPATMKRREKEVFWIISALGNLKGNKRNKLKSRYLFKHFTKTARNFSWLIKNSKNNCFAKHILMATSAFYILQCIKNTNSNNILIYLTHFESMLC